MSRVGDVLEGGRLRVAAHVNACMRILEGSPQDLDFTRLAHLCTLWSFPCQ